VIVNVIIFSESSSESILDFVDEEYMRCGLPHFSRYEPFDEL
jgi:hypothetical protein